MRKRIFLALCLILVLLAVQPARVQQAADPEPALSPLPELVAGQIATGVLSCPKSDPLLFEACLLYQGALGVWQNIGLPDTCPNVVDRPIPNQFRPAKLTTNDVI